MDERQQVTILLAEYHQLYALVVFRMTSLERRLPIAGATLAGFLGSVGVMPPDTRLVFLLGLPMAIVWFLRTTTNHARSFEDVLRRIEQIELQLNALAGKMLLSFQSQHPSRNLFVGGRTGTETVQAVLVTCLLMLFACGFMFSMSGLALTRWTYPYITYLALTSAYLVWHRSAVRLYRYERQQSLSRL